jgi:hypothetical protein
LGEINELRVRDLLDLARAFAGVKNEEAREANQVDIDAFYGR